MISDFNSSCKVKLTTLVEGELESSLLDSYYTEV